MIDTAQPRSDPAPSRPPLELSSDPRFRPRVVRLAIVSAIALGAIWWLAVTTLAAPPLLGAAFLAGWLLMPTTLVASLGRPRLRYALVVPATLVGVALLVAAIALAPAGTLASAGWWSMTAGVALGGLLGLWFWYRLVPVPASLDDPFAPGRWALIVLHIALIGAGFALAATALA